MTQISLSLISSIPCCSTANRLQPKSNQNALLVSRRGAAALLSFIGLLPSITTPDSATAFSIGISGPKDWLKDQKKKASRFLLAPIDASRETLAYLYTLLSSDGSLSEINLDEFQRLLGSAARDCVPKERNSFVEFQANTGVEVCTFRLLVNNAASLLKDQDPVKLEAEAKLNDVVRSFTLLYNMANQANIQLSNDRLKVANALLDTISSLDKFEQGIKDCLEI